MKTTCPHCGYNATNHETLDKSKNPKEGDLSVCINCGELSMFIRKKLVKEFLHNLDVKTKTEIKRIQDAWLQTRHMQHAVLTGIKEGGKL